MTKAKVAIQLDSRNVRKHSPANKDAIERSLKECGTGRSIVTDANNVIIAGNGVFEQAQKLGIPVKVIKSNGKELIAIQRTDLKTDDDKRKALAIADNRLTDLSEFDTDKLDELLAELDETYKDAAGFLKELEGKADDAGGAEIPCEQFSVVVECENEEKQQEVYNFLQENGYQCKLITL